MKISFDGAPVMRPVTQVAWEFGGIDKEPMLITLSKRSMNR
jgi:hypothetical protein